MPKQPAGHTNLATRSSMTSNYLQALRLSERLPTFSWISDHAAINETAIIVIRDALYLLRLSNKRNKPGERSRLVKRDVKTADGT